jgi:hypothetical protein
MTYHPSQSPLESPAEAHTPSDQKGRAADMSVESQVGRLPKTAEVSRADSLGMQHFPPMEQLLSGFPLREGARGAGMMTAVAGGWAQGLDTNLAPVVEARLRRGDSVHEATGKNPESDFPKIKVQNGNDSGLASPEFNGRVQRLADSLPEDMKRFVARDHVKISTAPLASTSEEQLPGMPKEFEVRDSLGGYDPLTNTLYISEVKSKDQPDAEIATTLRHEIGHAFDQSTRLSSTNDFYFAMVKDINGLSDADRKRLSYYTQGFERGRAELFAQLLARVTGPENEAQDNAKRLFPTAYEWVNNHAKFQ